jgi:predicted amidohydrolase YtcJ
MTTTSTLYRGGRVHSPCDPQASALLVTGTDVSWVGTDADAPAADRTVDLAGGLVTPAFVDAHVHATDTGLAATGLDLSATRSAGQLLDAVAGAAGRLPAGAVVLAHGWDESTWDDPAPPDAAALDRAAGGRMVYASQASLHSAVCSAALVPHATGQPGYHPGGWMRREAHHAVRAVALGAVGAAQRTAAQLAALRRAAALGIAAVHECGGPQISSEADFTGLLALAADPDQPTPEVYGYWGELLGAARARELGATGAGGDLFADGALGSQTAHLREPYADWDGSAAGSGGGPCGCEYLSVDQVRDHLLDCHRHRLPGGFHAIGDAALATVLAGFAAAAGELGVERVRAARHRIEHAELVDRDLIGALVEHRVVTSAQPAFDRLWGGERQMYAQRLGVSRSLASNPLGAMHSVGVALAFGSDSPVTPLDPWGSVRAAAWHHNPAHRLSVRAAFAAHTRGGWRAVGQDPHGVLTPGAPATFAVWDTPAGRDGTLPVLLATEREDRGPHDPTPLPSCRRTVLRGATIYDAGET